MCNLHARVIRMEMAADVQELALMKFLNFSPFPADFTALRKKGSFERLTEKMGVLKEISKLILLLLLQLFSWAHSELKSIDVKRIWEKSSKTLDNARVSSWWSCCCCLMFKMQKAKACGRRRREKFFRVLIFARCHVEIRTFRRTLRAALHWIIAIHVFMCFHASKRKRWENPKDSYNKNSESLPFNKFLVAARATRRKFLIIVSRATEKKNVEWKKLKFTLSWKSDGWWRITAADNDKYKKFILYRKKFVNFSWTRVVGLSSISLH